MFISINYRSISYAVGYVQKRKCGDDSRLFNRRLWNDLTVINDTMPHTWIVWGMCKGLHSHITIQEMSAVRCPTVLKTSTFSIKDCENTFYMSAEGITPTTKQN